MYRNILIFIYLHFKKHIVKLCYNWKCEEPWKYCWSPHLTKLFDAIFKILVLNGRKGRSRILDTDGRKSLCLFLFTSWSLFFKVVKWSELYHLFHFVLFWKVLLLSWQFDRICYVTNRLHLCTSLAHAALPKLYLAEAITNLYIYILSSNSMEIFVQ